MGFGDGIVTMIMFETILLWLQLFFYDLRSHFQYRFSPHSPENYSETINWNIKSSMIRRALFIGHMAGRKVRDKILSVDDQRSFERIKENANKRWAKNQKERHLWQFKRRFGQIILSVRPFRCITLITHQTHTLWLDVGPTWMVNKLQILVKLLIFFHSFPQHLSI